ncbi:MAG: hypothetical protein WAT12_12535 [Candidatus Nitrotoga sp.]
MATMAFPCNRYQERQNTFTKPSLRVVNVWLHAAKDSTTKYPYRLRGLRA